MGIFTNVTLSKASHMTKLSVHVGRGHLREWKEGRFCWKPLLNNLTLASCGGGENNYNHKMRDSKVVKELKIRYYADFFYPIHFNLEFYKFI